MIEGSINFGKMKNPEVEAVFNSYPHNIRDKLVYLRQLILDTAIETEGVGEITTIAQVCK
ncbi:MAG: hypothetical protein GY729_21850 [Desulfobacteraceae bacterium]|nr:hypothetical protein [Desulfobacteraceae bacterium]